MDTNQFHELRILLNSYRLPSESNQALVTRILNNPEILAQIVSASQNLSFNSGMVKHVISNDNFINQL